MNPTPGIHPVAIRTMKVRRKNHDYSEREARPLKTMYFWKQVLIDSVKLNSLFPEAGDEVHPAQQLHGY